MAVAKKQTIRGFTLVELLVTISIFVILTGVVLLNQGRFNSTILLTNLAYDTALTIRQAQTYGINIKEFNNSSLSGKFLPYGVHFDKAHPKSFILFADVQYDDSDKTAHVYSSSADSATCQAEYGCVNRYSIKQGNYISDLCVGGVCSQNSLDILFQRPNPDAIIFPSGAEATVILKSVEGNEKRVEIRSNGLIQILNN